MKTSIDLDISQMTAFAERTIVRVRRESRSIVRERAEKIFAESQEEVPVDTGTLRSAGRVESVGSGRNTVGYQVVYDGNAYNAKSNALTGDYMIKIHEDLSLQHPHGGKAKFLEDPVRRAEKEFAEVAARRLARALRRH